MVDSQGVQTHPGKVRPRYRGLTWTAIDPVRQQGEVGKQQPLATGVTGAGQSQTEILQRGGSADPPTHKKDQARVDYHMDLVDPKFSEVIPLFASFDPVIDVQKKSPIRSLFSAGRLHVNKGYNHLLDAMQSLLAEGHDVELTIAGDGPEMQNLVRQRDACMLFKLGQSAEHRWRRLRGFRKLGQVIEGVKFKDGIEVAELDN